MQQTVSCNFVSVMTGLIFNVSSIIQVLHKVKVDNKPTCIHG